MPDLPPPLTTRPLTRADARAVFELTAAAEVAVLGEAAIEEADIVADWQRPGFVLAQSTVGVLDPTSPGAPRLVGYAEVGPGGRCDAAVDPQHLGEGIGTWLACWLRERGRALGVHEVGMPVPQGSPGDRLLEELGWRVRWTSWVLGLPRGREVAPRALPPPYAVREARPEEHRALHAVVDDAFCEWEGRGPEDYADFEATVLHRPGTEPWNLRVAVHDDEVVGAVVVHPSWVDDERAAEAWVARLAVRADHRHRGLSLSKRVGMVVTATWVNRATTP